MDDMEMDFNESTDKCPSVPVSVIFKTPMLIDHHKLNPYTMCESIGYVSSSSPELNSTSGSVPCSSRMHRRMSSDSQLSVSPECSLIRLQMLRSVEASPDSGFGGESTCSSVKDSAIFELDEEMQVQPSLGTKRPAEPEEPCAAFSLQTLASVHSGPPLGQSTPFHSGTSSTRATFGDSCDFERSPTKRRRATLRKPLSRGLFQSSSKKKETATFMQPPLTNHPCFSKAERPSFVGRENIDFLYCLGKQSIHQPALDAVLGYLEPADLCRASIVSRTWKTIIESIPAVRKKKQDYVDECIQIKENIPQPIKKTGGILPFRGQLIEVQNYDRIEEVPSPGTRSPPVSPSKVRFNLFLKEGLKLESGQTLVQCPQCKLPARKEAERAARCTRRGCQFYFCILCLCKFHSDKICPVSSVKHRKRQTAIGSRESRRNLQRLCK